MGFEAIILVGHGGLPSDAPGELVSELKRLEGARRARGEPEMEEREAELDRKIREWPRTPESDPYKGGLEAILAEIRPLLGGRRVIEAYNEFCEPSVEDAIAGLAAEGATHITLLTTMFTRGGSHAEFEIPELVEHSQGKYPDITFHYVWPFDLSRVAEFLTAHVPAAQSADG